MMAILAPYSSFKQAIEKWDADPHRVHCSNCLNARVRGDPAAPEAFCAAGYGSEMALERLLRKHARGFASAEKCDGFEVSI